MTSNHQQMTALDLRARSFWSWFETVATDLARDLRNQTILVELDQRVSELGDVSWEVGPGHEKANALVITPDGSVQQLVTTRRIVALAPKVLSWEFYWAKPPRPLPFVFSIEGEQGRLIHVDARAWQYVLFRFPDDTFDIVLEQSNFASTSENDQYMAAVVLLDGVLGEVRRLESIGGIETVARLPAEQIAQANSINVLSTHLQSLVGEKGSGSFIP